MRMAVLQKLNINSDDPGTRWSQTLRNHKTQEIDQCADTETQWQ